MLLKVKVHPFFSTRKHVDFAREAATPLRTRLRRVKGHGSCWLSAHRPLNPRDRSRAVSACRMRKLILCSHSAPTVDLRVFLQRTTATDPRCSVSRSCWTTATCHLPRTHPLLATALVSIPFQSSVRLLHHSLASHPACYGRATARGPLLHPLEHA